MDTGYQGIQKLHANKELPKKRSKKNPLTKQDKQRNSIHLIEQSKYGKYNQRNQNIQNPC